MVAAALAAASAAQLLAPNATSGVAFASCSADATAVFDLPARSLSWRLGASAVATTLFAAAPPAENPHARARGRGAGGRGAPKAERAPPRRRRAGARRRRRGARAAAAAAAAGPAAAAARRARAVAPAARDWRGRERGELHGRGRARPRGGDAGALRRDRHRDARDAPGGDVHGHDLGDRRRIGGAADRERDAARRQPDRRADRDDHDARDGAAARRRFGPRLRPHAGVGALRAVDRSAPVRRRRRRAIRRNSAQFIFAQFERPSLSPAPGTS